MKDYLKLELCPKCFNELRADGRVIIPIDAYPSRKTHCSVCGKMRHTTPCEVSKEVMR